MESISAVINKTVIAVFLLLITFFVNNASAQNKTQQSHRHITSSARFHMLVLAESGGHHIEFTKAAKPWLNALAANGNFTVTYIDSPADIDSVYLSHYNVLLQLDYPPYGWPDKAAKAFQEYIEKGNGGWVGLHHASLTGEFDGFPLWTWWYHFMGDIKWKNYIPGFADGDVKNEDSLHPVMKGLPAHFIIEKEEWYTYDASPRSKVHVMASVNESSYHPASSITMGDHPVIWSNQSMKARNVYIFMGHSPLLFQNVYYTTLLRNAIFWAAKRKQ